MKLSDDSLHDSDSWRFVQFRLIVQLVSFIWVNRFWVSKNNHTSLAVCSQFGLHVRSLLISNNNHNINVIILLLLYAYFLSEYTDLLSHCSCRLLNCFHVLKLRDTGWQAGVKRLGKWKIVESVSSDIDVLYLTVLLCPMRRK